MSDDVLRQERKRIAPEEIGEFDAPPIPERQPAVKLSGNIPPQFADLESGYAPPAPASAKELSERVKPMGTKHSNVPQNEKLMKLITALEETTGRWEAVTLPSQGKFYSDPNLPVDGVIHVRAMTGEEEEVLGTVRYFKKGQVLNQIFKKCIREAKQFDTDQLLVVDSNYILIYLRGISYTKDYNVEIKCPECALKFGHTIDLDKDIYVDPCPDDFDSNSLKGVLPRSKFNFSYRFATQADEQMVNAYRESRLRTWGDDAKDNSSLYRFSLLIEDIEGLDTQHEVMALLEKLPMEDLNYVRNLVSTPPFGIDSDLSIICPNCTAEFEFVMPFEAGFFFPKKKRVKMR